MMTLDAVRTAVLSDLPWTRMDALVRGELAGGRSVAALAAELTALAAAVWGTPGLSDDGRDAFGDTLDALTGMCRPEDRYTDPPEPARSVVPAPPAASVTDNVPH